MREEFHALPGVLSVVTIIDPVKQKRYLFNTRSTEFMEEDYYPDLQAPHDPPDLPSESERRTIEGLDCYRVDLKIHPRGEPSATIQVTGWISERVGLVCEEFVTDSGAKGSWRLANIDLGEPSPELFVVPAGMTKSNG